MAIKMRELFQMMLDKEASDLFLRTNASPRARIDGKVQVIKEDPLTKDEMMAITNHLLDNEDRKRTFFEAKDVEFIHHELEVGRFRVNIFTQRGTPAVVDRHVHSTVEDFEKLNLPVEFLKKFCEESKGLFLV